MKIKTCTVCGKTFMAVQGKSKTCSKDCRKEHNRRMREGVFPELGSQPRMTTASRGALSELLACADLLRKGYDVFRAVSPNCSCDLIALRGAAALRIEVRTATLTRGGDTLFYRSPRDNGRYDHYAIVTHGGSIAYDPPLPE